MLENLKKLFLGKNPFIPIEKRMFILLLIMAILLGIIGSTINIILDLPAILIIAGFSIPLMMLVIAYRVLIQKIERNYSSLIFWVFIAFFPLQYTLNGGRNSNNLTLLYVAITLLFFILSGKYGKWFFAVLVTEYVTLSIIEFMYPQIINGYASETQRFIDVLSGNLLYLFILFVALFIIKNVYNFQIQRGIVQNDHLKNLNKQLAENALMIREINRQLEERRQQVSQVLDSVPAVVLIIQNENIDKVNEHAAEILGIGPEKLTGQGIYNYMSEDSALIFRENIRKGSNGEEVPPYEINLKLPPKAFLVHTTPVALAVNYPVLIVVLTNITELKEKEKALKSYSDRIERDNTAKARFISILSHDLRSPFQGLLGLSEILAEESGSMEKEKLKQVSGSLHNAIQTQYTLLNDILTWTEFQSDKAKMDVIEIEFYELVNSVIRIFDSAVKIKSLKILNLVPENLIVKGDVKMLSLVLRNLLSNAIKFSNNDEGIIIEYTASPLKHVFDIIDKGVGMSPALLEKIRAGQWGLSQKGTGGEKGSGIGLSLVREILSKHGGALEIESGPDQGTTARFSLSRQSILL